MLTASTSLRVATTRSTSRPVTRLMSSSGNGRERVVDRDRDPVAGLRDRHHAVLARERARDRLRDHVEVEVERVDLHVGQPGVGGERLGDLRLARERRAAGSPARREAVHLLRAADLLRLLGAQDLLRPRGRRAAPVPRAPAAAARSSALMESPWTARGDYRSRVRGRQMPERARSRPSLPRAGGVLACPDVLGAPAKHRVTLIGVPLDLGAGRRGVDMGPSALRVATSTRRSRRSATRWTTGATCRSRSRRRRGPGDPAAQVPEGDPRGLRRLRDRVGEAARAGAACRWCSAATTRSRWARSPGLARHFTGRAARSSGSSGSTPTRDANTPETQPERQHPRHAARGGARPRRARAS